MNYIKRKKRYINYENNLLVATGDEALEFHVYHTFNLFFNKEVKVISVKDAEKYGKYDYLIDFFEKDNIEFIRLFDETGDESISKIRKFNDKEDIKKLIFEYLSEKTGIKVPWGTMIGVRPVKFAYIMLKDGKPKDSIREFYKENYLVDEEKINLCIDVAEEEISSSIDFENKDCAFYIHMPFCPSRCRYCSFITTVGNEKLIKEYCDFLIEDIIQTSKKVRELKYKVRQIYFGGGTPTAPDDFNFRRVMEAIRDNIYNDEVEEFTVECGRVDSITEGKLQVMKECNVSRISINPQSFNEETLERVGRYHSVSKVYETFKRCRELGFDNINMDIILGLPGEGLTEVRQTLKSLEELDPDNITVHGLSIKRGSELFEESFKSKTEDINTMYEETYKSIKKSGYKPYYLYRQKNIIGNFENVGFSKSGKQGYYNIIMMEDRGNIISCGASSISKRVIRGENGKLDITRYEAYRDIKLYLENFDSIMAEKIGLFR